MALNKSLSPTFFYPSILFWILFGFIHEVSLFTKTKYISETKQVSFSPWKESLGGEENKTPQSDDYREKKQPMSVAQCCPCCSGWSLCQGLTPPESNQNKAFLQNESPLAAVWTIYNQRFLALSQLWHVHYFKILSAHPSSDPAQLSLWQKGSLGSNLMLILRNKFSASSLIIMPQLINERLQRDL